MHNRKPDGIASREIGLRDGLVLAPLVLCILGLALYPQLILKRTDASAQRSVGLVAQACGTKGFAYAQRHGGGARRGRARVLSGLHARCEAATRTGSQ